ncbi:MAG: hypothetical protein V7739_00115 [Motiliproteus sp.]
MNSDYQRIINSRNFEPLRRHLPPTGYADELDLQRPVLINANYPENLS